MPCYMAPSMYAVYVVYGSGIDPSTYIILYSYEKLSVLLLLL